MILIIDFGSQYNQLIARRVREHHVYCEIEPPTIELEKIRAMKPEGIILSGGPASIYEERSPRVDDGIFSLGIPILGICYGFQYLVHALGGEVKPAQKREYGFAELTITSPTGLFAEVRDRTACWMSHGDAISRLPHGFQVLASTDNTEVAAAADEHRRIYGLQFHPEVAHTAEGKRILANFLFHICRCEPSWTMATFVERATAEIKEQVGDGKVILGLSGGVDSSVTAILIHRAIGDRLTCVFVDNGLLREGEAAEVEAVYRRYFHLNLRVIRASRIFLSRLKGVEDPEKKRKIMVVPSSRSLKGRQKVEGCVVSRTGAPFTLM